MLARSRPPSTRASVCLSGTTPRASLRRRCSRTASARSGGAPRCSTYVLSTTTQPPCYPLLLNLRAFHYYSLSCTRRSLSSLSSLRAMHCILATMHCAPRTTCCPLHTHTHTHTHAHTHTHTHTHMHTHHTHMHMRALRLTPGAQLLHRLWQDRAWPGQGLGCDQDRGAGTWLAGRRKYVSRE